MKTIATWILIVFVACARSEERNTSVGADGEDLRLRMLDAVAEVSKGPFEVKVGEVLNTVFILDPLESAKLKKLIPTVTIHRMVSGRGAPLRAIITALVVNTNGGVAHLKSDDEVAHYLGDKTKEVDSKEEALHLVQAFADLRSYQIIESELDFTDIRPESDRPTPTNTDYKFVAEETDREWKVYATLVTDQDSFCVQRYVFSIWKQPGSGISLAKPVVLRIRDDVF